MNYFTLLLFSFLSFTLTGQCVKGDCVNGVGTMQYKSGNKYQGAFKKGKKHGQGKFIWTSGAKYKGSWVNNARQGEGIEMLADGTVYKGSFYNHKKHGQGALYSSNKKLIKSGEWKDGVYQDTRKVKEFHPIKQMIKPKQKNEFDRYVNLGVGFASLFPNTTIPPLSISAELKKLDNGLILGGYLGYVGVTDNLGSFGGADYGFKYSYIIFGGRVIYPFELFENGKTQTYAGGMIGYNLVKASFYGDELFGDTVAASRGSITYNGFVGVRHPINDGLMLFGELGYGISYITAGISRKF